MKHFSLLKNNKGFSLLEMLVVIVIMAIMVSLATLSMVIVHNANVSKAGNNLEAAINTARVQSMSKGTLAGKLTLTMEGGALYAQIGDGEKQEISSPMIQVYYQVCSGADPTSAGAGPMADGAVYEITFNSAGMVTSSTGNIDCFTFVRNNRKMAVEFYPLTGKVNTFLL